MVKFTFYIIDNIQYQLVIGDKCNRMHCSIESLTYNYKNPQQVRQLNLQSSTNKKIHTIENLDNFVRLKVLILSNNLINRMSGLQNLHNLRVLNLEFNQLRVVEGTNNLKNLQQLYLSYNEIQAITEDILSNRKLRILHLAYNDIANLDSISILYRTKEQSESIEQTFNQQKKQLSSSRYILSQLTTFSIYGNPIIQTINYLSFFKMLIPSLRVIDDKNVDDEIIMGNVCPQEEVFILREAINKLLDQRNTAVEQLQNYASTPQSRLKDKKQDKRQKIQGRINQQISIILQENKKISSHNKQLVKYLQNTRDKYLGQLQINKQKITELSQKYSQNIRKTKKQKKQQSQFYEYISVDADLSQNTCKKQLFNQSQIQNDLYSVEDRLSLNRQMLKYLKQEELKLQTNQTKVNNIDQILIYFELRHKCQPFIDYNKLILELVLFGFDLNSSLSANDCQKLCKKYLIKPAFQINDGGLDIKTGLIEYSELLRKIVYGQSNQGHLKKELSQLIELKSKIKKKGLLQIIAQLKQENAIQDQKHLKFEKERKNFIQKFQKETKQLSKSWQDLKKQKQKFEKEKQKRQQQHKQAYNKKQQEMIKKYRSIQEQQKDKIVQLKRKRQLLQNEIQRQKNSLYDVQQKLSRKFLELEQFQNHFNEFIQQKQHIKSLEQQINQITKSLGYQKQKYQNLTTKVKQLTLQESILENKINKLQQQIKQRDKQVRELQRYRNQLHKLNQSNKEKLYKENEKLRDIVNTINNKAEQAKDYEKLTERSKKNYNIMQQKVKNIQQMQSNKKLGIRQLQQQIRCLKQDKQDLIRKVENLQKNMQSKRQQLLKLQLKIQENKFAMEQLSDINKSISDMMVRQSELKRSIIELEIQNKNLMDMKNNLLDDFKIKQYV